MRERILKYSGFFILSLILITAITAVLFPVYAMPQRLVFYASLIALAGFVFVMSGKLLKEQNKIETPVDGFLFFLFLWTLTASVFSINVVRSLNETVLFLILLLLFYTVFDTAKKYTTALLIGLFAAALISCLFGFFQFTAGFKTALESLDAASLFYGAYKQRLESGRIFSFFIYPNAFASFLIMLVPVSAGLLLSEKKYRPVSAILLIILLSALFLTKSMGAFISLFLASIMAILISGDESLKTFRSVLTILLIAVLGFGIAALVTRGFNSFGSDLGAKFSSYIRMAHLIKEHFILGYGPGNFEQVYNASRPASLSYLKYAHNAPLQAALETGIVGLAIFLFMFLRAVRSVNKNYHFLKTTRTKILVVSLLTGLTAFLIHNLSDFSLFTFENALVFTILSGILMSQIKVGLIEIKRIKLSYLLGINPGLRRELIFYLVAGALALSLVTGGKHPFVLSSIYILITAGFALWSVSKEDIRRTALDVPLLLLSALSIISLLYVPDLSAGFTSFKMLFAAVILYFLSSQFLRRSFYRIVLSNVIIISGGLAALTACGQFIYSQVTGSRVIINAFFPNQNLFAGFLSIPLALVLCRVLLEKKIDFLFIKLGLIFLFITAAALSGSKGGMITMIFTLGLIWLYYSRNRIHVKDNEGRARMKLWLLRIAFALLIVLSFTGITPSGKKLLGVSSDPFYFNRFDIYKASIKMGFDSLLTGRGLGGFEASAPPYNFPVNSTARFGNIMNFAHNEYLQVFCELGITGLVLVLLILLRLLRFVPVHLGHKKLWSAGAGAYFALTSVAFHSMMDFNLHQSATLFISAVLASFVMRENDVISTVPKSALMFTRVHYFPALILAAVFSLTAARPVLSKIYSDNFRLTSDLEKISSASDAEPVKSSYALETYRLGLLYRHKDTDKYLDNALYFDRNNVTGLLYAARRSAAQTDIPETLKYYALAKKADPLRALTFAEEAEFRLNAEGNSLAARSLLESAVDLEPNFVSARVNLSSLYMKGAQYKAALEQLDEAEYSLNSFTPLTPYEEALMSMPGRGPLYSNKAKALKALKHDSEACEYSKKAVQSGMPVAPVKGCR